MKAKNIIGVFVCLFAVAMFCFKSEFKAAFIASAIQLALFTNNKFFFSLVMNGFTATNPYVPVLDMGEANLLKMKLIYVARYIFRDQFLFSSIADGVLSNIEARLDRQFAANGWTNETFANLPVPSAKWGEIEPKEYLSKYVLQGIPFILKDVPSEARDNWSPEYLAGVLLFIQIYKSVY